MCEEARVCNSWIKKARVAHRCCECRREIAPGEPYEYTSGVWGDGPANFKTCLPCAEQRAELITEMASNKWWDEACVAFGELRETWFDYHDVRPVPAEIAAALGAGIPSNTDDVKEKDNG